MSDGTCSIKELVKILGTPESEILTLVKDGVIAEKSKGKFIPLQAVSEYIQYLRLMPGTGTYIDGEFCVSSKVLREIFKCEESTIMRWGQKGCPRKARGMWALSEVMAWRGLINVNSVNAADEIEFHSLAQQKAYYEAELKKAQVEEREIKNAISRGDYIPKGEIVEELKRFLVVLKKSLKGYSRKVATEISFRFGADEARSAERMVSDITDNALEQLSIDGVYDARKATSKA